MSIKQESGSQGGSGGDRELGSHAEAACPPCSPAARAAPATGAGDDAAWSCGKTTWWFPVLEDGRRKQKAPKKLVQQRVETLPHHGAKRKALLSSGMAAYGRTSRPRHQEDSKEPTILMETHAPSPWALGRRLGPAGQHRESNTHAAAQRESVRLRANTADTVLTMPRIPVPFFSASLVSGMRLASPWKTVRAP